MNRIVPIVLFTFMFYLIMYWTGWLLLPLSSLALWLKANPSLALELLSLIALSVASLYTYVKGKNALATLLLIVFILMLFLTPIFDAIQKSATASKIKVIYLKEMPEVYGIYRLIPLPTAYAYASDRIQIPTHTIYFHESYVYYIGKRPVYNWVIEPEGLLNSLTREPRGAVFVYGDVYPPEVKIVEQRLVWGLHNYKLTPLFADSLALELIFKGAFAKEVIWEDVADVFYEGKILQIIPVVDYEQVFPGALPVVKGFYIVYPNGKVDFIKPEEVGKYNVPALPEKVARQWIEALRFKDWFQALFFHNTFIIRDVGDNPQPYLLVDKKGGIWWVFVAEPPGRTYSAYMMLLVNASSTKPVVYVYKFQKPEIGVSKVKSYVMKAHPNWAWDQLLVQEPMPSYINNTLMWKVAVTTKDSRGLISVEFLNATSGTVKSIQIKGKIRAEDLLKMLTKEEVKTKRLSVEEIIKKIEKIKRELNELEKLIKQIASNSTS